MFQNMAENDPTKYPVRMGKKWEEDEVLKLLTSIQKKKPITDIATEHQRTTGAIQSERRKLAANYWFHDKRPIEEIIQLTGLTKEQIEDTIKKRNPVKDVKTKQTVTEELVEIPNDMKDVIILLKDIQSKLSFVMEKIQSVPC
jgi:hypothetical protein